MRWQLRLGVFALAAGIFTTTNAVAAVILSDSFDGRTEGLAELPADGGFSAWGTVNNALGGSVSAPYLTTNATSTNQQTVEGDVGVLRFGRTILDYNLATDPTILANGQFTVEFQVNPTDQGGGGFNGRDWAGLAIGTTNSTATWGGSAFLFNANASSRLGIAPRNSGTLLSQTKDPYVLVGGGNPNSLTEPIFDPATYADYASQVDGAGNLADDFVNPNSYPVRIDVDVSNGFTNGATAFATVTVNGVELLTNKAFTWNADNVAYIGFNSNGGPAEFDNLIVSSVPEPSAVVLGLLAASGILTVTNRRRG